MGTSLYTSQYLKPHKWTYEREMVERSNSTKQRVGTFKIMSGINRPRHVFIWFLNDASDNAQAENPFLYNTFNINKNRPLVSCHLVVGNGVDYPENEYSPSTNIARVVCDVLSYTYSISNYPSSMLLARTNFQKLFPFIYFDLRYQKEDLRDGAMKLTFKYGLSAASAADYSVYALVLYEEDVELVQTSGKLLIRS